MKLLSIFVVAAMAVVAASCGSGTPPDGSPTAAAPTQTSSSANADTMSFEVWFDLGEYLFVTRRTEASTPRVGTAAVEALLAGPSAEEQAAGIGTSIPGGTELLGLSISGGIATANLNTAFGSGGGSLSMFTRLAQLTYTLMQFPAVHGVDLEIEGEPVTVFGTEGIVLDQPMTRASYADRLPPILVRSPLIGQDVTSPIRVAGTANVFEAVVSITLLDANGNELVSTTTMATCGTGCRGAYAKAVPYTIAQTQTGTVRVYEVSAKNGTPTNVVEIPVTLTT